MLIDQLVNLAVFILMLGSLILIHELGHFVIAVRLGVKVKEFGLGLPPKVCTLGTWRGTTFTLNWIPLGGFIRPEGENDPAVPGGLAASAPRKRLAILAAGPAANLLLGFLILIVGCLTGWPDTVRVVEVTPNSPAANADLRANDIIVQANGQNTRSASVLADTFRANLGTPFNLTVQRGGVLLLITLIPRTDWSRDGRPTGMKLTYTLVQYPLFAAVGRAWEQLSTQVQETLSLPAKLLRQDIQPDKARFISPVGLKQVSDRVVENSRRWNQGFPILSLLATISIALGLANLLPIPALDGGRILFVLVELLRGQRANARFERWAHIAGLVALLSLTLVLVVQDIAHPLF